jgi:CheR methyltransferase, all-alpha domain
MAQPDPSFEALIEHLRASRGFDFTGYERTGLVRRVEHRMSRRGYRGEPGPQDITLKAVNRRGRTVAVRVHGNPLTGPGRDLAGVILTMEHLDAGPDGRVDGEGGDRVS